MLNVSGLSRSYRSLEALFLGLWFLAQHLLATTRAQVNLLTHNSAEMVPFVFFCGVLGALGWPKACRQKPLELDEGFSKKTTQSSSGPRMPAKRR